VLQIVRIMPTTLYLVMVSTFIILGLYCSSCLAQVKDVNPDQFVSFGNLATIIINLVDDYDKSNKS